MSRDPDPEVEERLRKHRSGEEPLELVKVSQDFASDRCFFSVPVLDVESRTYEQKDRFLVISDVFEKNGRDHFYLYPDEMIKRGFFPAREPYLVTYMTLKTARDFIKGKTIAPTTDYVFEKVKGLLKKYVDLVSEEQYNLVTIWIMGTYVHRLFSAYPYLHVQAKPGSGKTRLLNTIAALSFNGLLVVNPSMASLFRMIDRGSITACIDEAEKLLKNEKEASDFAALLNAGYSRGASVSRIGEGMKIEIFDVYSPKVIANISGLGEVLGSRSIKIQMIRSKRKDVVTRGEPGLWDPEIVEVRDLLYLWALENWREIRDIFILLGGYLHIFSQDIHDSEGHLHKKNKDLSGLDPNLMKIMKIGKEGGDERAQNIFMIYTKIKEMGFNPKKMNEDILLYYVDNLPYNVDNLIYLNILMKMERYDFFSLTGRLQQIALPLIVISSLVDTEVLDVVVSSIKKQEELMLDVVTDKETAAIRTCIKALDKEESDWILVTDLVQLAEDMGFEFRSQSASGKAREFLRQMQHFGPEFGRKKRTTEGTRLFLDKKALILLADAYNVDISDVLVASEQSKLDVEEVNVDGK